VKPAPTSIHLRGNSNIFKG